MIDREDLETITTIVTHDDCPDGMASAIILADALPDAKVLFVQPGAPGLEPAPGMLFCDVTPDRDRAERFADAGAWVLDHHEKQRDIVSMFQRRGIYTDKPGSSGAMLALEEVWRPSCNLFDGEYATPTYQRALQFAVLAGIRDTWQTGSPLWISACEQAYALLFHPRFAFASIRDPFGKEAEAFAALMAVGPGLRLRNIQETQHMIATAFCHVSDMGTRVTTVPTEKTSDIAEALSDTTDIVAGFLFRVEDKKIKLRLSFRSHTGRDVGDLAKSVGGGGHTAAAGATLHLTNGCLQPYAMIAKIINDWERAVHAGERA